MNQFRALVALLALCACGPASNTAQPTLLRSEAPAARAAEKPATGRSREPTPSERKLIKELMAQTEQVRELKFLEPVPVVIQDRAAITAYIEDQIENEELDRAKTLYSALGLLERDVDIKALLVRVLGEQILGYFDPKQKRLVVRDDIMRSIPSEAHKPPASTFDEAKVALVHELVHALQCQHLGLSEHVDDKRDADEDNAYRALIEGDASLAMIGFLIQQQQPGLSLGRLTGDPLWLRSLDAMAEQLPLGEIELANAPEIVRGPLLFAYLDGLAFASYLHGRGGWKAVDKSYRRPPLSTKQVLHPERYLNGGLFTAVRLPDLPSLSSAGYRIAQEDSLGELEIGIFFNQALEQESAKQVAEGWNGDRVRVYRDRAGKTPIVWFTAWDGERQAMLAEEATAKVLQGQKSLVASQARVVRQGQAVLVMRMVPSELQAGPIEAFKHWAAARSTPEKEKNGELRTRSLGPVLHEHRDRGGQAVDLRPKARRSGNRTRPNDSLHGI
jgi:hypothetical protein